METFLPVRLEQIAKCGCRQFQCSRCEGERYLVCRRRPSSKDIWERLGFRRCDACLGNGKITFAMRAVLSADDDYATRLLRRVNRALCSRNDTTAYFGVECAEILHEMRDAAQCCRRKFKTFCSSTDDWARLEKRVARAKSRLDEAERRYFNSVTQQRLERAALLRDLQNEAAQRSRESREATLALEENYLSN